MSKKIILTINPGSTSTKIALFNSNDIVFLKNISHSMEDLNNYARISDQFKFRKEIVLKELKDAHIDITTIQAIVARGGLVKPIPSGVYEVNEKLINDLSLGIHGQHASNLGGLIAADLVKLMPHAKAFIADPVVVDELDPIARISGHPEFQRISIFHALNQKAIARMHALAVGRNYEDMNLIVAHLGGGITVGAHKNGRVVDVNQGLDGDGPFSPERSGTLPVGDLVRLCFSGKYTRDEILRMITGKGGYVAYLGTNSAYEIEQRIIKGDENAKLIQEAMAYQVSKEIGAMCAVLEGKVDAILLTGGLAFNRSFVNYIKIKVGHIATIGVYPGEDEMRSLAKNGLMVLEGEVELKKYE